MFGRKHNCEEKTIILYSEKLTDPKDDTTKKVALATPDGGVEKFRTGFFMPAVGGLEYWLEAYKDRFSGLWNVNRHERMPGTNDGCYRCYERVLQGVCFFDALEYCARWEQATIVTHGFGQQEDSDPDSAPYYRLAAEKADIPLDRDGQPHPAAWGEILTEGDFDGHAYEVAKHTQGREIGVEDNRAKTLAAQLAGELPGLKVTNEPAPSNARERNEGRQAHSRVYEEYEERVRLAEKFEDAAQAAHDVKGLIDTALARCFGKVAKANHVSVGMSMAGSAGEIGVAVLVLATTPLHGGALVAIPLLFVCGMGGLGGISAFLALDSAFMEPKALAQFKAKYETFANCIKNLPSCRERRLAEDFAKATKAVFGLEHAALIHRQCRTGKKRKGCLKAGRKILDKAIKESGMTGNQANNLKLAYGAGNFAEPGSFLKLLDNSYRSLDRAFEAKIEDILTKGGGAGGVAKPPAVPRAPGG